MPSVKYFSKKIYKLRGLFIQAKIKIINKGLGLLIVIIARILYCWSIDMSRRRPSR